MKEVGEKKPGQPASRPLLDVRDLRVSFGGVTVVDGVSLQLEKGEVLGVVGESGSGKSATALAIMRLISPPGRVTATSIMFDGEDLQQADDRRMRATRGSEISMIFQEPMSALNPVLPVGEQIVDVLRKHKGLTRRQARLAAIDMLGRVGIPSPQERVDSHPHEMSGGMRQRAMIAMALACSPRLLIADEPTTALDVTIQAQILDLLASLKDEMGMSMILITHDLGVVAQVADRVNVMYAGRVVETASTTALFKTPSHPYTAALLGSMPSLTADVERLAAIPGTVPQPSEWGGGCRFAPRCSYAEAACTASTPPLMEISAAQQVACIRHTDDHRWSVTRDR